jgi:hypothetical protein
MSEETYTAKIDLFSQWRLESSVSMANALYEIKLPQFRGNKRYVKCYVEAFNISVKTLTPEEIICVRLMSCGQPNSYDVSTEGESNILITAIPKALGTNDYGITASNNLNPIQLGSIPTGIINIRITDAAHNDLDLANNVNDYSLHLRIECHD